VPLRDASRSGDGVAVPVDKATVKDAPKIDPDGQLSQREEAELYRHYGLQYGESQAGQGAPEGNALSASTAPTTRTPPAPSGGTCPARRPMTP
jgi:hypothetical protein